MSNKQDCLKKNNTNRLLRVSKFHIKKIDILLDKIAANRKKYNILLKMAKQAMAENKIFMISGNFCTLNNSLKERGWIEKLEKEKLYALKKLIYTSNMKNIDHLLETIALSRMVRNHWPDFMWNVKTEHKNHSGNNLINKIELNDYIFTRKNGLSKLKNVKQWFCIEDVSTISIPRTYDAFDSDDLEDFKSDYKLTACTNLLKWFNKRFFDEQFISIEGSVPYSTVKFALRRCKSYITHRENDYQRKKISSKKWSEFLENSQRLIKNMDDLKHDNDIQIDIKYSNELLELLKKYNPQLHCDGILNIWIIKPSNWCRGKGIKLESNLNNIIKECTRSFNNNYVIQKYIEEPFLIHNTKFDIRQYYIISNIYPLTLWMYKNCYMRFSSQNYNLKDFHESIHLTNNAVQCKYNISNQRNKHLPECNMWNLNQFKNYLTSIGYDMAWDELIYPEMKKNIIGTMLGCQAGMAMNRNTYELYGCDFILDGNLKPWLIEINSHPDLSATTPVTFEICNEALGDLVKVIVDKKIDCKASTGDFECIYKQTITKSISSFIIGDLTVHGTKLSKKHIMTMD